MKYILPFLLLSILHANPVEDLKYDVCDNVKEIWGWCSKEKASHFVDLVLQEEPQLCVEIGVFAGASLYPVASALQFLGKGIIIAIDPWDKIECIRYLDPDRDRTDLKWWAHQNLDHIYFGFLHLLKQFELEKNCLILRATSKKAAPAIGIIDILHIDGNHFRDIVIQDVQLYLPKVKIGGYIWLNDAAWVSVQPAIELLLETCEIVKKIDNGNCILFKKKL
jgi:hypothetical protein